MPQTSSRLKKVGINVALYAVILAGVVGFSFIRARMTAAQAANEQANAPIFTNEPFFSLTTNRTYSPSERVRVSASYRSIDHLDFRVYHVNDPLKFFKQLENPHQVGEDEKEQLSSGYQSRLRLLERTHSLKSRIFTAIKDYIRVQLQRDYREKFNKKFRPQEGPSRTPLNVADYARVPLLNSNQLVSVWRERLPISGEDYDEQMINVGPQKPGVYLIEAVNENLRAYSIAIVTELTLVQKTTRDGQLMVYIVERKSGVPHPNVAVEVAHGKDKVTTGTTDKSGIFKTEVPKPDDESAPAEDVGRHQSVKTVHPPYRERPWNKRGPTTTPRGRAILDLSFVLRLFLPLLLQW